MKSLEELAAIREKMKHIIDARGAAHDSTRVTVGMGTCGIAAGARAVLNTISDELVKHELHNVLVTQNGYLEPCQKEPIVEVSVEGKEKVVYVNVTPEKAVRIIEEHLIGGKPVAEYTDGGC